MKIVKNTLLSIAVLVVAIPLSIIFAIFDVIGFLVETIAIMWEDESDGYHK